MGMDYYLERPEELPADRFAAWARDVRKVIDALPVPLIRTEFGTRGPIITDSIVSFNGNAHYAVRYTRDALAIYADPDRLAQFLLPERQWPNDEGEDFHVARVFDSYRSESTYGWFGDSFRTRELPYDIAVIAALILFAHHFVRMCRVSSDYRYEHWEPGLALAEQATGLTLRIPWSPRGWMRARLLPPENFCAWSDDVARVIATAGIPVAGPDGTGKPILTDALVAFNGVGDDACQPLRFSREYDPADNGYPIGAQGWIIGGVAAQGKPYDLVVAAALILLDLHFPLPVEPGMPVTEPIAAARVGTDGWGEEEWRPGLLLARSATGRAMGIPPMDWP